MQCPHCQSEDTRVRLNQTTSLGYPLHFCRTYQRSFTERTGTLFDYIEVPTDIVFQVLYCRLRFKLSYRDVAELFWLRGFHFTHETVRDWSERFTAEFAEQIRVKRHELSVASGLWTKPTSRSREDGATSIAALMNMAIC